MVSQRTMRGVVEYRRRRPEGLAAIALQDALDSFRKIQREHARLQYELIRMFRYAGATWDQVAEALDLASAHAARKRYNALRARFDDDPPPG